MILWRINFTPTSKSALFIWWKFGKSVRLTELSLNKSIFIFLRSAVLHIACILHSQKVWYFLEFKIPIHIWSNWATRAITNRYMSEIVWCFWILNDKRVGAWEFNSHKLHISSDIEVRMKWIDTYYRLISSILHTLIYKLGFIAEVNIKLTMQWTVERQNGYCYIVISIYVFSI